MRKVTADTSKKKKRAGEKDRLFKDFEETLKLSEQVVRLLQSKNLFITTVESCTGGGVAHFLTNVPGASGVMKDALITYSNEAKMVCGVPQAIIDTYTVYSNETAEAMADAGIRESVRADVAVGITGSISRKDPLNSSSIPGEVYISVRYRDKRLTHKLLLSKAGERWEIKGRVIRKALLMVMELVGE